MRCKTPVSALCFSVYDDGAGITKEVAERLFTPFFTTRASGTGLGLAIVKRVIEAHGGEVSWHAGGDSREEGVAFHFTIPLSRESSIRASADASATARASS